MPKMKTNKSAAKRVRTNGGGKVRRPHAGLGHMMRGKSAARRRKLRKHGMASPGDSARMKRLLPNDN